MSDSAPSKSVIGGPVVDGTGRSLGRVIGLIYKTDGVDVLVESGRWWRRRGSRFPMERITVAPDGTVVVDMRDLKVRGESVAKASAGLPGAPVGKEHR